MYVYLVKGSVPFLPTFEEVYIVIAASFKKSSYAERWRRCFSASIDCCRKTAHNDTLQALVPDSGTDALLTVSPNRRVMTLALRWGQGLQASALGVLNLAASASPFRCKQEEWGITYPCAMGVIPFTYSWKRVDIARSVCGSEIALVTTMDGWKAQAAPVLVQPVLAALILALSVKTASWNNKRVDLTASMNNKMVEQTVSLNSMIEKLKSAIFSPGSQVSAERAKEYDAVVNRSF
uniref:Uncharacterized protein n=1 Tax=Timema cristinae TaxID=61476 RepID=A0A7R9CTY7_TIMCR|nr:unnamed protein product [Timema cristinae]